MYTTKTWTEKAAKKHDNRYDYSKVDYKYSHIPVTIICPIHGDFEQVPSSHLYGRGCPKCNEDRKFGARVTTNDFITRARAVHGDFYIYDKTMYQKAHHPLIITCPIHGDFEQRPHVHLGGCGCPICRYEKSGESNKKARGWDKNNKNVNEQPFVIKSKRLYGESAFDYSAINYINNKTPVCLKCNTHNEWFLQRPNDHLSGYSKCTLCKKDKSIVGRDEFIRRCHRIHDNKYNYSRVEYVHIKEPVEIICPEHGSFYQTPDSHFKGHGCSRCAYRHFSDSRFMEYYRTEKRSSLYVIKLRHHNNEVIKVGLSNNLKKRYSEIRRVSGSEIEELYSLTGSANSLWEVEKLVHHKSGIKKYAKQNWKWHGSGECYPAEILPQILEFINKYSYIVREPSE